ncbi:MAG: hypothetical protein ABEJ08_00805 [Halobacteriaceae archaeon]
MIVPITEEMMTDRELVDVRVEERATADFDLSGRGPYVELGDVEGRLVVEYEINRGELMDRIERGREPTLSDRLNMFLEDWSLNPNNVERLELDYGRLLLRGTDPVEDVPDTIVLSETVDTEAVENQSPSDLKRDLRREMTYSTTFDALEADIRDHLEQEGIPPSEYELGAPVHIQARADPIAEDEGEVIGTEFTITVENNREFDLRQSELRLAMPPEIGREVELRAGTSGTYNPAEEMFEFTVPPVEGTTGTDTSAAELTFLVPPSAGRDLEVVEGDAELDTRVTFSYLMPDALFDAGGRKTLDYTGSVDREMASIQTTATIEASFHTPTDEILVGEGADVEKRISVEGVTPPQAISEVEQVLGRRSIDATTPDLTESRNMREGEEVTEFQGEFRDGSVVVEGTRIAINVKITGQRRAGEVESERTAEETLPAERRSVTMEYGRTGLVIQGRGADWEKVDSYVSDLRDDLQMSLESIAEEV